MSVKAMGAVWERSRAKGSNLLVLLAIADYAKDDGRDAWPTLASLATKTRLTEKAIKYILKKLQVDGEIVLDPNDEGRTVKGNYEPELFLHVLCVSENFSQPVVSAQPEHFSDQSENDGLPYKEDPSLKPSSQPSVLSYGDRRKKQSHRRHMYCGQRFCVPDFLHDQFRKQLGSAGDDIELEGVEGIYADWDKESTGPIVDDPLVWLRRRFTTAMKAEFGETS